MNPDAEVRMQWNNSHGLVMATMQPVLLWAPFVLTIGSGTLSGCWCAPEVGCGVGPDYARDFAVAPVNVRILRGDTVRLIACANISVCGVDGQVGNVPARWILPDDSVLTEAGEQESAQVIESAEDVLVRGTGLGRALVAVQAIVAGVARTAQLTVTVADSSSIAEIVVIRWDARGDTLRLGSASTPTFDVRLRDPAGFEYRAWPTGISVSDSTLLRIAGVEHVNHAPRLIIEGLKPGSAELRVQFLSVTKAVRLTIVR